MNWWFATSGDPGVDLANDTPQTGSFIGSKLYDIEQITMHEMLHGLGFISGWYPWISSLPNSFLPGAIGMDIHLTKVYKNRI